MAHHFFLLRLNPFSLGLDSEGWWFEKSVAWLEVWLSADGSEYVSVPWLSLLRSWGSLTMISTGKFLHMAQHFLLPWLNPFGLGVERVGW